MEGILNGIMYNPCMTAVRPLCTLENPSEHECKGYIRAAPPKNGILMGHYDTDTCPAYLHHSRSCCMQETGCGGK